MILSIAQIILEEARFGHVGNFLAQPPTEVAAPSPVELRVELLKAPDGKSAVVRLRAGSGASEVPYSFSISYLVIFGMEEQEGVPTPADLDHRLLITGGTMAFPFVRECVANLTSRGRFGPSWLAPTDFNQIALPVTSAAQAQTESPRS